MLNQRAMSFKLLGFVVKLDWLAMMMFLLVTWSLGAGAFPFYYPDLHPTVHFWMGLAGAVGLFLSIVAHELLQAVVARSCRASRRGMSLFIEVDRPPASRRESSRRGELLIASAGPTASVVVSAVCLALALGGGMIGLAASVRGVLMYLGSINLIVLGWNIVAEVVTESARAVRWLMWKLPARPTVASQPGHEHR